MSNRNSNANVNLPTFLPSSASLLNAIPGDVIDFRNLYTGFQNKNSVSLGFAFCDEPGLEFSTKNSKVLVAPRKRFTRSKYNLRTPDSNSSSQVACKKFLDPDEELIFSGLLGTGTLAMNKVAYRRQMLSNPSLQELNAYSGSIRSPERKNSADL